MELNNVIPTNELLIKLNIKRQVLDSYRMKRVLRDGIDYVKINGSSYVYSSQAEETLKQYKATHKGGRKKGVKSSYSIPSL